MSVSIDLIEKTFVGSNKARVQGAVNSLQGYFKEKIIQWSKACRGGCSVYYGRADDVLAVFEAKHQGRQTIEIYQCTQMEDAAKLVAWMVHCASADKRFKVRAFLLS